MRLLHVSSGLLATLFLLPLAIRTEENKVGVRHYPIFQMKTQVSRKSAISHQFMLRDSVRLSSSTSPWSADNGADRVNFKSTSKRQIASYFLREALRVTGWWGYKVSGVAQAQKGVSVTIRALKV